MGKYKLREILKAYRRSQNLTQGEMAQKLFMARQTYAKYESTNAPIPDLDTLCRMAEAMDMPVDYLLFGKETSADSIFRDLPRDLQLLCKIYFRLNIQNMTNFQFMCIVLKFLKAEQKRGAECTHTKSTKHC